MSALVALLPATCTVVRGTEAFPLTSAPMFALSPPSLTRTSLSFSVVDRSGDVIPLMLGQEQRITHIPPRDLRRSMLKRAWGADAPALTWPLPAAIAPGAYGYRHGDTKDARRERMAAYWRDIVDTDLARKNSLLKKLRATAIVIDAHDRTTNDVRSTTRLGTYAFDTRSFTFGDE